jgi:hypothetical protein
VELAPHAVYDGIQYRRMGKELIGAGIASLGMTAACVHVMSAA